MQMTSYNALNIFFNTLVQDKFHHEHRYQCIEKHTLPQATQTTGYTVGLSFFFLTTHTLYCHWNSVTHTLPLTQLEPLDTQPVALSLSFSLTAHTL